MKLLRNGPPGQEKPGALDQQGRIRDLSSIAPDLAGPALLPDSIDRLRKTDMSSLPLVSGTPRLGPCVSHVGKFICFGLNYSDHAAETGMAVPAKPVDFMKATSSVCGPKRQCGDSQGLQENRLGSRNRVIGNPAKYVSESDALSHVAGYCVVNDVSERGFHCCYSQSFQDDLRLNTEVLLGGIEAFSWMLTAVLSKRA